MNLQVGSYVNETLQNHIFGTHYAGVKCSKLAELMLKKKNPKLEAKHGVDENFNCMQRINHLTNLRTYWGFSYTEFQ